MVPAIGELERGRESYATSAWLDAYESLSRADQLETLVAQLDEEVRAALQREVVDDWQQFTGDGTLILQLGITTASARK
ncbi:MAG TPA: hypothetical protein VK532_01600 [Gaiellaceae bacterium]|jgi:hypothetical protein|nr:hypothetical protein [Gaiellaceae bacterium]